MYERVPAAGTVCGRVDGSVGRRTHTLSAPVIVRIDDESVLLTHGDALCTDDHAYQELRSIVRDPVWQRRFLSLPLERPRVPGRPGARRQQVPHVENLAAHHGRKSERGSTDLPYRTGKPNDPWSHPPARDARCAGRGGQSVQRIVLGAWYEQGSFLLYQDGQ